MIEGVKNKMPSESLTIHYERKPIYDIVLSHSFEDLAQKISLAYPQCRGAKACIVSDSHTGPLYSGKVHAILDKCFSATEYFEFPAGEQSKNLDTVQDLYEFLIRAHFERRDVLVALGGGVAGDLAGYAAATYLRGIRFLQIPTSLLAQVDSSIGGKTGVDFRAYKNMVGAFHQPSLVYSNVSTLKSLSERQYISGLGEIVKHGLIRDRDYYEWLKASKESILARNPNTLVAMIRRSDEIKQAVVENDPKEQGERAVLNFGHTLGHSVEKLMNFTMLHGECVSIGIAAASFLSMRKGMITEDEWQDILSTLTAFGLPVKAPGLTAGDILKVSKSDKKMDRGRVKFILLDGIGNAVIDTGITDEELLLAADSILEH